MILPKSICLCISCFKFVIPGFVLQSTIFAFFGEPDMDIEVGVVMYMYLKHSQDCIDSKYMSSWSNSLGSSVFADILFLTFLALHRKGRDVARWGTFYVIPRVKLYMHTKF